VTRLVSLLFSLLLLPLVSHATESTITFERFGTVHLYSGSAAPAQVALFVSGDGGWNQGVVDMARELANGNVLVAGIDINHYLKELAASDEKCAYPAADFEALSQFVQKSRGYSTYVKPILVGYSSGATLVYATLVQAPSTTFRGAVSLGFCPDLDLSKPFCTGSGIEFEPGAKGKGVNFLPAKTLRVPWIALQGEIDKVCDPPSTQQFVARVPNGEVVMLPKVGHGYSVPHNWLPQFKTAFAKIAATPDVTEPVAATVESLHDLPLHEVAAKAPEQPMFCLHITGDGGYGVTDRGITEELASKGIPCVVLNSLHYFWKEHTPQSTTDDVARVLRYYLSTWKKDSILLVGYSRGADALPFVVNRLPADLKSRVRLMALVGAAEEAEFELTLTGWLGRKPKSYPVLPEIEKLRGMRMVCFYGTDDKDAVAPRVDPGLAKIVAVKSGHRLGSNFDSIVKTILDEAEAKP
jgi:type IV secretory pathway VirJ component